jgi:hypothetical protein
MSYVPSHDGGLLAQPESLVFIPMTQSSTQAPAVNTAINLDAAQTQFGAWSVSITSDIITLPSPYFYLIESSVQAYYTGSAGTSDYYEHQVYDETNSNYVGSIARIQRSEGEDTQLESRDEKARYYVNVSSGSLNISIKTKSFTSNFNRINYNGDATWTNNTGSGRVIIWRLNP